MKMLKRVVTGVALILLQGQVLASTEFITNDFITQETQNKIKAAFGDQPPPEFFQLNEVIEGLQNIVELRSNGNDSELKEGIIAAQKLRKQFVVRIVASHEMGSNLHTFTYAFGHFKHHETVNACKELLIEFDTALKSLKVDLCLRSEVLSEKPDPALAQWLDKDEEPNSLLQLKWGKNQNEVDGFLREMGIAK
ncbi:MAG: hypothetical protein LBF65_01795 [Holosporales bacterium]|jgi:hypothetical protein|nr:hypothetical protein [Holosporales bacterium]